MEDNKQNLNHQGYKWMIVGVVAIMVILLGAWITNFKSFINPHDIKPIAAASSSLSWSDLKTRFDSTMNQIGVKLSVNDSVKPAVASTTNNQLQNLMANLSNQASTTATTTASSSDIQAAQIKDKLNDLQDQLERNNP